MKVISVSPVTSFSGIKVENRHYMSQKPEIRDKQKAITGNYESEAKLIEITRENKQKQSAEEIGSLKSLFFKKRFEKSDDLSSEETDKMLFDSLGAQSALVKRKAEALLQAIEDTKKADAAMGAYSNVVLSNKRNSEEAELKGFDRIAGYDFEKEILKKEFIIPVNEEREGKEAKVYGSILFFGPYNNGKTTITDAVAEESGCDIVHCSVKDKSEDTFKDVVKTAKNAQKNYKKTGKRTIIFVDEADGFMFKGAPIIDDLSKFLKECSNKYKCTLFASTNNPLRLGVDFSDSEIFPIKMSIDPADSKTKAKIFEMFLHNSAKDDLDYNTITKAVEQIESETGCKFSNGQLKSLCTEIIDESFGKMLTTDGIIDYIQNMYSDIPQITPKLAEKFNADYDALIL